MQRRMPGVCTGGVRAHARVRATHQCPFCSRKYRRLDHYNAHLQQEHDAELGRADDWDVAQAEPGAAFDMTEESEDVFKHAERPIRRRPVPAAEIAAGGAGASATQHHAAMLAFIEDVCGPILRGIAADSGVYVAALEEYQRALRAHEERTRPLDVREH